MGGTLHPLGFSQVCFCGNTPNGHMPGPFQNGWMNKPLEKIAVKSC